jgi:hypothetical protein
MSKLLSFVKFFLNLFFCFLLCVGSVIAGHAVYELVPSYNRVKLYSGISVSFAVSLLLVVLLLRKR